MLVLSSTIRMRWLGLISVLFMGISECLFSVQRNPSRGQFQSELGAFAGTVTARAQASVHLLGRVCAAVQSEPVTVFLGGKSVVEDFCHVLWWDADPVVADDNFDAVRSRRSDADDHAFLVFANVLHGMLGIAEEVDENLQKLMAIDANLG